MPATATTQDFVTFRQDSSGYVGIGRLAAESPQLCERAEIEYFDLKTRSALNREASGRMPFAWTLNPYRGCEFGCKYCYARYTHEFMEIPDGNDFERRIFAKVNMPDLLRAELATAKDKGRAIALGTATDPYQPAERQLEITRRVLQAFTELKGLDLSITTKSVLVLRDLDLMHEIACKHRFSVHITVTTMQEKLARLLEPKAPPPAKRLDAVQALARAGIRVGVNIMPVMPGINDSHRSLEDVVRSAARAGAQFVHENVLFLMPSTARIFMPFLEKDFPRLVRRYRRLYARSAYLRGEYPQQLHRLMGGLREHYRLNRSGEPSAPALQRPQMALPF